jgi:transcription elongation factor GreA
MVTNGVQKTQLTQDGHDEIIKELKELEEVKLPEVIKRVETARGYGDLSENAEYHSAREDQELIETRIADLKAVLLNSTIVKQSNKAGSVGMGSHVSVAVQRGTQSKRKMDILIVGEFEADPPNGKISSVSPLGKALFGKKKGDKVEFEAPVGQMMYEILEIK